LLSDAADGCFKQQQLVDKIMSDNETPSLVEVQSVREKRPGLLRNYVSYLGMAISAAALTSFILLLLLSLSGTDENPYTDLIIFILVPSIIAFGLSVMFAGVLIERRRRKRNPDENIAAYPILDLNDPRRRRAVMVFMAVSIMFLFMSAFGSYRAYEYTESVTFCGQACHSVMKPEFIAYNASPHARVKCVECHVGGGAGAYVNSKFAGMRQLYGVATGHYNRPILTPVHNMRAATETCQKCHWSEKYHGDVLKVFNHYESDEKSSLSQTQMLVKVGGGDPATGPSGGIHWHMNIANEVDFVSSDERRQVIPWVRIKDATGQVVEYTSTESKASQKDIDSLPKRRMDCIDCHNRPAHEYLAPNTAVDRSLDAGRLNASLPFIKAKAVETLSRPYSTNDEATAAIANDITAYYQANYPSIVTNDTASVAAAVAEIQRIYQTYFFPEMKTDWQSHPNNIGHLTSQGCFRCHDGLHVSQDGRKIRNDCNICHTTLSQTFSNKPVATLNGTFQHPINLGDRGNWLCASCHKGDRPFKHPLNLGDISMFQCAECHKQK
jgi:NapC/NirT cytochrome c family, N-terminal region